MVQNLIWSGVYLIITLSYAILQKVPRLLPMAATGSEIYVVTTTTVIYDYYDYLEDNMKHLKII